MTDNIQAELQEQLIGEYYVLRRKYTLYRVSAASIVRAKEIVEKRPSITVNGNVLQAFGVDPDDESLSTLYVNIPDDFLAYKIGEQSEPPVLYTSEETDVITELIKNHVKHKLNNRILASLWSLRNKLKEAEL